MAGALAHLLGTLAGLTVVGQAADRAGAIHAAMSLHPELVILDLRIRDADNGPPSPDHGLATLRELVRLAVPPRVLVFSSLPETTWLRVVARAGAVGFMSKDTSTEVIITALQAICAGMSAFTTAQLQSMEAISSIDLSPREREVLQLLAEGLGNQEIADRLTISAGTVRKHVERLCAAFGAHSRGQVVAVARREGMLP